MDEGTKREWHNKEATLAIRADMFNDPARTDKIHEEFEKLMRGVQMDLAVDDEPENGAPNLVTITINATHGHRRPMLNPDGTVWREGDPGIEPWPL